MAGWSVKSLGEIAENLDSRRIPITKSKRETGEIPYYGASGVVDHVKGYLFDEPLLLVSEDGANLLARTYPIAFSAAGKTWVNNHAHVLRFSEAITRRFVELFLNSISLEPYVSGMAQPKLNQRKLASIPIPLPPLEEQRRIVAILDKAFEGLDRAKANAEANLKSAVELFLGELKALLQGVIDASGTTRLGEVCEFKNGFAFKSARYRETGTPVVRISNIQNGEVNFDGMCFIDEAEHTEDLDRYVIRPGDLLIAMSGATTGKIGFNNSGQRLLQNQRVGRFVPGQDLDEEFLFHVLTTKVEEHLAISAGAAQPNLSTSQILNIDIPRISLDQQKALVRRVSELHDYTTGLSHHYEGAIDDCNELRQSLLTKAFAGNLG